MMHASFPPRNETDPLDDAELSRALGTLVTPAPSEMLSARLKRAFPGSGIAGGTPVGPVRRWSLARHTGTVAMAASLVLAVALGIAVPPRSGSISPEAAPAILPYDYAPVALYRDADVPDDAVEAGFMAEEDGTVLALPLVDGAPWDNGVVLASYEGAEIAPSGTRDAGTESGPASWDDGPLGSIPLD